MRELIVVSGLSSFILCCVSWADMIAIINLSQLEWGYYGFIKVFRAMQHVRID